MTLNLKFHFRAYFSITSHFEFIVSDYLPEIKSKISGMNKPGYEAVLSYKWTGHTPSYAWAAWADTAAWEITAEAVLTSESDWVVSEVSTLEVLALMVDRECTTSPQLI